MLRLESIGKNSSVGFQGFIQRLKYKVQSFKLSKLKGFSLPRNTFWNLDCSLVAIEVATSFNLALKKTTSQEAQEAVAQALQVLKEFYAKVFWGGRSW